MGEDTSIHVVVRCRGRNEREVKENSGVVVATEGVKGKSVELSMGPNAVSNKTYYFDKAFSPAADQAIIYEEVVAPILSEVFIPLQLVLSPVANRLGRCFLDTTAPSLHMGKLGPARRIQCLET
jgi:hypothetical protein